MKKVQDKKLRPHIDAFVSILRNTIKGIIPKDSPVPADEVDALARLCTMSVVPSGEEDPKKLMRLVSDPIINHLVSRLEEFEANPILKNISQFFLIEWCYRNGHLNGDWVWNWEGQNGGHVSYDPKVPLEEIELPSPAEIVQKGDELGVG
jgi:hypothetical protein